MWVTGKINRTVTFFVTGGEAMKKWIMSSLAILLGILSISIPLAGVRTAEAGTTKTGE